MLSLLFLGIFVALAIYSFVSASYLDDSQVEFDSGTYVGTDFDSGNGWVELATTTNELALPNGGSATGWFDMSSAVLLLHLNEDTGASSFTDNSSNSHTVSCSACPDKTTGQLQGAFDFNGTSDVITIADADDLSFGNATTDQPFTISAWVKMDDATNFTVVGKGNTTAREYYLIHDGTDKLTLRVFDNDGLNYMSAVASFAMTGYEGKWTHVVGTYDGSRTNAGLKLYVDGASIPAANSTNGTYVAMHNQAQPMVVGNFLSGGSNYANGVIDEVAIFTKELTATEINFIYKRQSPVYAGYYESQVFDATQSIEWLTLAWTTLRPYGAPLPNNKAVETAYTSGNIDMSNNALLHHFDESSGTATDNSGNGLTGTVTAAVQGRPGVFGTSYYFDGTDDYVTLSNSANLSPEGGVGAISAWVKTSNKDAGTEQYIYSDYGTATNNFVGLSIWGDNTASTRWRDGDGDTIAINGAGGSITDGKWHHLVAVRDTATTVKLYVDGVQVGSGSEAALGTIAVNSGNAPRIGILSGATTLDFRGHIDEVAYFNEALTPTTVRDMYLRGALTLGFQVRSCNDSACSGEVFTNTSSATTTLLTEGTTNATTTPSFSLSQSENRYFQYRAFFGAATTTYSPELLTVSIGSANIVPVASIGTASQTTAGVVTVTTTISDIDSDATSVFVEYSLDNSTWVSSTISGVTLSEGAITTSTGQISGIDTDLDGSVDLTIEWNIATDVPNTDDTTVYLRIIPNDGTANGTTVTSQAFAVDTKNPTTPGNIDVDNVTSTTLDFLLPSTTSTDTNFLEYRIYTDTSSGIDGTESNPITSSTNPNLGDSNFNGSSSFTVSGLTPNTTYYAKLFAYDTWGNSISSDEGSTTTLAAIPSDFTLTPSTTTQIDLSWGANNNPGSTVYDIRYNDGTFIATTTATSYSDTGLSANTQYSYKVRAINSANVYSDYTDSASAYTFTESAGQPTVTASSTTALNIVFASDSNPSNTTYAIYNETDGNYLAANGSDNGVTPVYQTTSTWGSAIASGLSINTSYQFSIIARNGDGVNSVTSTASVAVYTLANSAGAPTVNSPTTNTLNITISTNSNPSNTTYAIYNSTDGNYLDTDGSDNGSTPIYQTNLAWGTVTATGLTPNTSYQFQVIARNGDGINAATSTASTAVYTYSSVPTSVSASALSTSTMSVSFTGDGTSYIVTVVETSATSTTASSPATISGLTCGTTYTFTVKALNANGDTTNASSASSGVSTSACEAQSAGTPTVTVSSTTALNIIIDSNGNPADTTYSIYNETDGNYLAANGSDNGDTPVYQTTSTWGASFSATGLSVNTSYQFSVIARNSEGSNAATSTASAAVYTLANQAGTPTVNNPSSTTLDITINTNSNPSNTTYSIYNETDGNYLAANGSDNGATPVYQTNSAWGTVTATGLTPNTSYQFQVIARNGDSVNAATSTANTAVYTYASVPTSLSAVAASATSITLSFTGDGTSYIVTVVETSATSTTASSPATISGLTCGTTYTFTVKAINTNGDTTSASSASSGVSTSACGGLELEEEAPVSNSVDNTSSGVVFLLPPNFGGTIGTDINILSKSIVFNNNKPTSYTRRVRINLPKTITATNIAISFTPDFSKSIYRSIPKSKRLYITLPKEYGPKDIYMKLLTDLGQSVIIQKQITYTKKTTTQISSVSTSIKQLPTPLKPSIQTTPFFTTFLSRGQQGPTILALQRLLQERGYFPKNITPNGVFGPSTEVAVKAFQQAYNIDPLGYVGPSTREALNSLR